jgi:hypothetical protein
MADEIVNRVANSKLVTIDLEDFYPEGKRVILDIKPWLHEGIVLREKDFREFVKNQDWDEYKDCYVALTCSSDAIIPGWAFMLISAALAPFSRKTIVGSIETLDSILFDKLIEQMDLGVFKDKSIIIKGCAHKPIPQNAFVQLTQRLQPIAKSVMYGEACSAVPLFKKK